MADTDLQQPGRFVCVAEDRESCEPAIRILLASLQHHSPNFPVILFCPNASEPFRDWVGQYDSWWLNPWPLEGSWTKYDIKPLALLTALRAGLDEVIWIDSDVVIARDITPLFAAMDPSCLAATEEALGGGRSDPRALRARLWNFAVGREFPFTANTAVIRVTSCHLPLLDAWNELLQSHTYRLAQDAPWYERPSHLAGDQEVLTALLTSTRFADIPICFLRRGSDIIQFFGAAGYTVFERIANLFGAGPRFIHSQGLRPWWPSPARPDRPARRFTALYNSLSPYLTEARRYPSALADSWWLDPPTPMARFLAGLTPNSHALTGLPLAAIADCTRWARSGVASVRRLVAGLTQIAFRPDHD